MRGERIKQRLALAAIVAIASFGCKASKDTPEVFGGRLVGKDGDTSAHVASPPTPPATPWPTEEVVDVSNTRTSIFTQDADAKAPESVQDASGRKSIFTDTEQDSWERVAGTEGQLFIVNQSRLGPISFEEDSNFGRTIIQERPIIPGLSLSPPVDNRLVTMPFSLAPIPGYFGGNPHYGVDYGYDSGPNLKCVLPTAKVEYIGQIWGGRPSQGSGPNGIILSSTLEDGRTVYVAYGHAQSVTEGLQVGSEVRSGDVIGQMGNWGLSTGTHLHAALYIDGEVKDYVDEYGNPYTRLVGGNYENIEEYINW